MRRSTCNKLRKLEELTIALLVGRTCEFCDEPLIKTPPLRGVPYRSFISGTCKKQLANVTIHHLKTNRRQNRDNRPENLSTAHSSCHRSHHAREIFHSR